MNVIICVWRETWKRILENDLNIPEIVL